MNSMKLEYERVYAKINLDALLNNYHSIKNAISENTKIFAVLKTDAYGHGAIPIAKALENDDKLYGFALATTEEALMLRNSGIYKPLLVLGYTFPHSYEDMVLKNICFTVFREDMLETIAKEVRRLSTTEHSYVARVHIKVDTGMGRIGILPDDTGLNFVKKALEYPEIKIEGIFTHLAKSDEEDKSYTYNQIQKFNKFVNKIENETGYKIPLKHVSNSAGIIEFPEANLDIVRAGIILYGMWPSPIVNKDKVPLRPVFSLHSQIVYLKEVPEGTSISYGGTFITPKTMKVATIPVGYGDGYPRTLSNKADVLIKGRRCPIIGRVCMDQLMVDVSDIDDVTEGEHVTLIGRDGADEITMEELGDLSGRFNYEMACDFGKRIPRVFVCDGEILYKKDYHMDI